jgi:hypothetical protein
MAGYRPLATAPLHLGDLDHSVLNIVGKNPIVEKIAKIVVVANRYVICTIDKSDMTFVPASEGNMGGLKNGRSDLNEMKAILFPMQSFNFGDLKVSRVGPSFADLPYHPASAEWRVRQGQHGWLVGDKRVP